MLTCHKREDFLSRSWILSNSINDVSKKCIVMQGNRVTHHLETEGWNKGRKSRIYSTYCCQVLAVNCHEAWRLFEQHSATYLRTSLTNRSEVHYEIRWIINLEMRFVIQTSSHLLPTVVMRIRKKLHCIAYGCKTRSLIKVFNQGHTNPGSQFAAPTKFCMAGPNTLYVGSQYETTCHPCEFWGRC